MAGAVVTGQLSVTKLVAGLSEQTSRPVPLKVVVTEQVFDGTVKAVVKLAEAPGASAGVENTAVLAAGRSLVTTTLVKVMLPVLRTVPA